MLQAHGTTGVGAARRNEAAAPPKLSVVAPPVETAPDAAISTEAVPAVAPPTRWRRRYQTLIFTTDAIAAVVAAGIAYSARFGESHPQAVMGPLGFALLLPPVWLLCV